MPRVSLEIIQEIIYKLLNNKAPSLDKILNKALKLIAPTIKEELILVVYNYLASRTLLEYLKELYTIVLCKEGKKDYSLLGSYQLIALKNTLSKVIKKHVANTIADAVEAHSLLPQNQIGARKKYLILLVVGLLSSYIQIVQRVKYRYIVLILSLNLARVFNNISYNRLLYIL